MRKLKFKNGYRKIHVSWLIAWCSVGVVLGIAGASILKPGFSILQLLLVAFSLLVIVFIKRQVWMIILVLLAGFCFGFARGAYITFRLADYDKYIGKNLVVSGVINEDVSFGKKGDQRIKLRDVKLDLGKIPASSELFRPAKTSFSVVDVPSGTSPPDKIGFNSLESSSDRDEVLPKSSKIESNKLPGEVWLSTSSEVVLKRSDTIKATGLLSDGFGTTPASIYDATIISTNRTRHGDIALEARDWFAGGIRQAISEPQASLGAGFLLGQRSSLPESLDNQLRLLGLTHIVVASGYNLTILVRFSRKALAKRSKYLAVLGSSILIVGFVMMTGFSPSMSRAALVAGISLLAWYFGRNIQPLVILSFSAAITSLLHPAYVWGDLGWYLSFLSFAGIMLLAPLIQHYFWGPDAQLGVVRRVVVETLSAQLATLPLIAWVFGQYSVLSLPANVLILPLVPLAMAFTFVAGIGALSVPAATGIFGIPALILLTYMTTVTGWLSQYSWASAEAKVGVELLIIGYAVLLAAGIYMWRVTKHRFSNDNIIV